MIQQMKADNFKCFEHIDMEFSNLNLFSGVNSMGKSTLIQMFLLLRQSYEQNALEKGIYLNGKYTNLGIGKDVLYTDSEENTIHITVRDEEGFLYATYAYNAAADFLRIENIDRKDWKNINLFYSGFHYIAADRLGPQSSYEKSYHEVWDNNQVGNHGEYAVHYLQAHSLDEVENECVRYDEEENIRLLRQVECWMGEITPGVSLRMEEYGHSNRIGLMVHQAGSMGADYYTAQNVGFGISYVLPVVLALLKAKKGELLILENPEAHLHPRGQRKMGELIARAAQVYKRLLELQRAGESMKGNFDKNVLTKATPESEATLKQYSQEHTFQLPDGRTQLFSWHTRYTGGYAGRIFFYAVPREKIIYIGYIEKKLPTAKYH